MHGLPFLSSHQVFHLEAQFNDFLQKRRQVFFRLNGKGVHLLACQIVVFVHLNELLGQLIEVFGE